MHLIMFVYVFLLFFVLTPGVLVYLPPKAGKMVTAATHALIFALIWTLTHKMVWRLSSSMEGMYNLSNTNTQSSPSPVPRMYLNKSVGGVSEGMKQKKYK